MVLAYDAQELVLLEHWLRAPDLFDDLICKRRDLLAHALLCLVASELVGLLPECTVHVGNEDRS